jgi:hypothetical protein
MRPRKRLFFLGSRLVALGIGVLVAVSVCAGVALALGFTDVKPGDDYSEAIADLSNQGIINGFEDGTFQPRALVTRQQFAKMIVLTLGLSVTGSEVCPFSDVVPQIGVDPFYPSKYVAVCAANDITKGTNQAQTLFSPYRNITRAQVMTMVVRAAPLVGVTLDQPTSGYYSDPKKIMENFDDPNHGLNAQIAEVNGLLWGIRLDSAGVWEPYKNATRGEVAQILWRLLQKIPSSNVLLYDDFSDPNSGWYVGNFTNSWMRYDPDEFYRMGVTAPNWTVASWRGEEFEDMYCEAWAWPMWVSGDWDYGLVFRLQDIENRYELRVMGNDTAQLWRGLNGRWTAMSPPVDLPQAVNSWRHLEVIMVGDSFAAWVDGIEVGEFTDGTFATGKVGFYVATGQWDEFDVYFDDFAVYGIVY